MKYNYYGYKAKSKASHYLGDYSIKVKISFLKYCWLKITGHIVTKELKEIDYEYI